MTGCQKIDHHFYGYRQRNIDRTIYIFDLYFSQREYDLINFNSILLFSECSIIMFLTDFSSFNRGELYISVLVFSVILYEFRRQLFAMYYAA